MDVEQRHVLPSTPSQAEAAGTAQGWRATVERDDLLSSQGEFETRLAQLSQTELTVLSLMARGLLNKQIAHHCGTAQSTIKSHVTQVLRKLGARSRTAAAVRYAVYADRLRCASQRERTAA